MEVPWYERLGTRAQPIIMTPVVLDQKPVRIDMKRTVHDDMPEKPVQLMIPHNEDSDSDNDNKDDSEHATLFWNMIDSLHWRNLSDGRMDEHDIRHTINGWDRSKRKIFRRVYETSFAVMSASMVANGIFEHNNIQDAEEKAKIISHTIALGKDQFHVLLLDPSFVQFFIEAGECQSLEPFIQNMDKK